MQYLKDNGDSKLKDISKAIKLDAKAISNRFNRWKIFESKGWGKWGLRSNKEPNAN